MAKRKILFTTAIRSDFFIQNPVMEVVRDHKGLECLVIVTGAHLCKEFGYTIKDVKKHNYRIVAQIKNIVLKDDLSARIEGASIQLQKLIKVFKKVKPDIVIAPFDREEAITVALAGVYMGIPVAHLGAGDRTKVNVDGIIRHGVTKLSHLSFTSTEDNRKRIIRMGEDPWRVFNSGHPGLDRYNKTPKMRRKEVGEYLKMDIDRHPLLVNLQHPVSEQVGKVRQQINTTLQAIDSLNVPAVIIYPNSDPGRNIMVSVIEKFKFKNNNIRKFINIPEMPFINIMRHADVLVGNSSMGILDSALLKLPVVNVGDRQKERQNAGNVVFIPHDKEKIIRAVKKCLFNTVFIEKVNRCKNPYGNGKAGEKIADILNRIPVNSKLLSKNMTY